MGELADEQNAILRALHEEWHAPLDLLEKLTRRVPGGLSVTAEHAGWQKKAAPNNLYRKLLEICDGELNILGGGGGAKSKFDPKICELKIKLLTAAAKLIDVLAVTEGKLAGRGRTITSDEGIKKNTKETPDEASGNTEFNYFPADLEDIDRQITEWVEKIP